MPALPRLRPLDRDTLWDRAYAALKAALLGGHFAPGERIVLRDVAEDLGISLTPVRDAVNRLIAERILERGGTGHGGGATVGRLDAGQFSQLMTVRSSLEAAATFAAAQRAQEADLDKIEQSLVEMKRSVEENRVEQYLDAHYQFHFGIYELSGMPLVQEIIENAWLRCGPVLTLALPEYIPGLKRYPFHVEALAGLRARDGERAARAIRADIESAREDICLLLDDCSTTARADAAR
jgi:DNA-binding GntR family transcriptional regulator